MHIVTGPPAGGKTSFVAEHARPGDIRVDLDHLANLLAGQPVGNHEHAGHVLGVARTARNAAIDAALKHSAEHDVWIIDSKPTEKNLQRYQQHGARIHVIDPGKSVVMARCKAERPADLLKVAALWYETPTLKVRSFAWGKTRTRGLVLDARHLPNPYDVPALRVPDGTSRRVREWFGKQPAMGEFIAEAVERIERERPSSVWVGCSAGKHRSVYVADEIAAHFGVAAEHTGLKAKGARRPTTTERGYGWDYQQRREQLIRRNRDGAPCWWCGLPMYRDPRKNWDGNRLSADHDPPIRDAGTKILPNRLVHESCNKQRGAGDNDHRRPAITGAHPSEPLSAEPTTPGASTAAGSTSSGVGFDFSDLDLD
nr:RNase adapter RapZ [Corynebacterium lemuris]